MTITAQAHIAKSKAKSKVHLEKPRAASEDVISSICGDPAPWRTEGTLITFLALPEDKRCTRCFRVLQRDSKPPPAKSAPPVRFSASRQDMVPSLSVPERVDMLPRMTPELFRTSCKGAVYGRCRSCWWCEWEASNIDRYAHIEKTNTRHAAKQGEHPFSSLNAALNALYVSRVDGARSQSHMGPMLDRCRDGLIDVTGGKAGEDFNTRNAGDLARVSMALDATYPEGWHETVTSGRCRGLLVERAVGLGGTLEETATRMGIVVGEVRTILRFGRDRLTEDLFEKGLIPRPRVRRRRADWHAVVVQREVA